MEGEAVGGGGGAGAVMKWEKRRGNRGAAL